MDLLHCSLLWLQSVKGLRAILNNRKQDEIKKKPDEDVHQVENERIPSEEEGDSP
jgi:hypothetical protein